MSCRFTVLTLGILAAACGGGTDPSTPPPPPPPPGPTAVASVALDQSTLDLVPQFGVQLTATPKDANGTALAGRTITWQSSATTVASVSGSGQVNPMPDPRLIASTAYEFGPPAPSPRPLPSESATPGPPFR